jgi:hypothetical protein
MVEAVPFKELQLKGINNPVVAYRVLGLKEQETDAPQGMASGRGAEGTQPPA